MHTYVFNSDLGTFEITNQHPSNHHHRMYELWLEDEKIGEYASAQEAAEDMAAFNTGYTEWDSLEGDGVKAPQAIEGWTEVVSVACEDAENLHTSTLAESPFLNGDDEA
jgi:hypothetical protein